EPFHACGNNRKGARRHGNSIEAGGVSPERTREPRPKFREPNSKTHFQADLDNWNLVLRSWNFPSDGSCPRPDGHDDGPATNGHERRHDGTAESRSGTESDAGIHTLELEQQSLRQPGLWLPDVRRLRRWLLRLCRELSFGLFRRRQLLLQLIWPPAFLCGRSCELVPAGRSRAGSPNRAELESGRVVGV